MNFIVLCLKILEALPVFIVPLFHRCVTVDDHIAFKLFQQRVILLFKAQPRENALELVLQDLDFFEFYFHFGYFGTQLLQEAESLNHVGHLFL